MLNEIGFQDVAEVRRFDSFMGTSKERTARAYAVEGANFYGTMPNNC